MVLYKVRANFEIVDKIQKRDHSNENYSAVCCIGWFFDSVDKILKRAIIHRNCRALFSLVRMHVVQVFG